MKIWHSGAHWSPLAVNGVNALIYTLAQEQVKLGHEVTLLVHGPPDEAAQSLARDSGVQFLRLPTGWAGQAAQITSIPRSKLPDLVHMHSVFIPEQWALGKAFKKLSIPFVITPHAGLSPHILARSRWKKAVYSSLIERPRFRASAGISVVTPKEKAEVLSFVSGFGGPITWIPNAVDPAPFEKLAWSPRGSTKIVYLGRFDIVHKGIDLLLDLARRLGQIEFHLYGPTDKKSNETALELKQNSTPNVFFHGPVYGPEKAALLAGATLYLQMSRWEGFPISIIEAMYLGLPCALASVLHIASLFEVHDLGLLLPQDLKAASDLIWNALSNPERLQTWSLNSKNFAAANFRPRTVALRFLEFYQESLDHRRH